MVPNQQRITREERLREEFNRRALTGAAAEMERLHGPFAERVLSGITFGRQERLLEAGCGNGWLCRLLSARVPEGSVVGIDLSDEMIRLARQQSIEHDNILYAPGSAEEIPWAEDYFDRVFSVETAYYWHSAEWAAREMFRVAAWGGRIYVLLSYYRENPSTQHWQDLVAEPLLLKGKAEWTEVFELLGFERVEATRVAADCASAADFEPSERWRTQKEWDEFFRNGPLLITAKKPELPPPGPLEGLPLNPLRIV